MYVAATFTQRDWSFEQRSLHSKKLKYI